MQADERDTLLRATATGNQSAFARLYDLVAADVYALVRRVLRDPAQSEEVTQEVMVQVWRTAPRFAVERGSARSWILTIAHRRAIDRVRSEQALRDRTDRAGRLDAAADLATASDPADQVIAGVIDHIDRTRVADALELLTPVQRQAVDLAYFGGYTQTEIADILDVPLGTVKTRVRDGLIRLRDQLGASV